MCLEEKVVAKTCIWKQSTAFQESPLEQATRDVVALFQLLYLPPPSLLRDIFFYFDRTLLVWFVLTHLDILDINLDNETMGS